MSKPLVYLAGAITGMSYGAAVDWRKDASRRLAAYGIGTLSPMRWKNYLSTDDKIADVYDTHPLSSGKGIVCRDNNDVMRCDAVLMNLLGLGKVSVGSMIEAGLAYAYRKPLILVLDDLFDQVEQKTVKNPHDHGMLTTMANFVVKTVDVATEEILPALLLPDRDQGGDRPVVTEPNGSSPSYPWVQIRPLPLTPTREWGTFTETSKSREPVLAGQTSWG